MFLLLCSEANRADQIIKFTPNTYSYITKVFSGSALTRVKKWERLFQTLANNSVDEQLYEVNRFFNSVPYYTDKDLWSKSDYWATPIEMLGTNWWRL